MEFKFVDNHAHLNFAAFKDDYKEAVKRAHDAGVAIINVGTKQSTSLRTIEMAEEFEEGVYSIIGLHPVHTGKSFHDEKEIGEGGQEFTSSGEKFDFDFFKKIVDHPKVLGIGECGLDYYRLEDDTKKVQMEAFEGQIELSLQSGKPLMLHIREAYDDAIEMLKARGVSRANVHFFAGTKEIAQKFLDLGCTLSFTGVITFAKDYKELVEYIPLDRMLSETDCPYVAPIPYRGKRNEPLYVVEVVKKIAEIKNLPFEGVAAQLRANTKKLFNI